MMRETIELMFRAIDASDWNSLPKLFSTDCVYERPGYPPIEGREALDRFYREERRIASGQHLVQHWFERPQGLMVAGSFRGRLRDGQEVAVEFADCYCFADGLIGWRKTYFYAPLV